MFTTALDLLVRFRGEGGFGGWLFQIARNAINDAHREPTLAALAPRELTLIDPEAGPDEQVLRRQRLGRLRALVRTLPAHSTCSPCATEPSSTNLDPAT